MCNNFNNNIGEHIKIHAVPRWYDIQSEGPAYYLFFAEGMNGGEDDDGDYDWTVSTLTPYDNNNQEIPASGHQIYMHSRILDVDLINMADAVNVDNDNPPTHENIPCDNYNIEHLFG